MRTLCVVALTIALASPCLVATGPEMRANPAPPAMPKATPRDGVSMDVPDDAAIDRLVTKAPKSPHLDPSLKVRLVDFIDCTRDPGPSGRPYLADAHSRVTTTNIGIYRETGTHANSWFAYRFRTGGKQKPHIILVEYPDDAYRCATVFLNEKWMKGTFNSDYHAEGGYWSGREVPTSDRFQALEFWLWPTDKWPSLVVMNHTDSARAAASRIWVYEVTGGLPPARVTEPAGMPHRKIGTFFEDTRMFRYNFGTSSAAGVRRLVEYVKLASHNMLSFDVVLYRWNKCSVPAFDANPGGSDHTEQALAECDRAGVDFIAVFDPVKGYKIKGREIGDLTDDVVIDGWVEGIEQFVDKYGKHPSLKGISFGGPAGCNRFRSPRMVELQLKLYAMLQQKRPDLTLHVFYGNEFLHKTLFNTKGYEPYNAVIAPWEAASGDTSFADILAGTVDRYWREHLHMPVEKLRGKPGLVVHRSFYPNDHRCFEHYPLRTPRFLAYRDYDRSQKISDSLANGGAEGACIFGSYFEMVVPLWAPERFWSQRTWIGPQVIAAGDHALAAYTEPLYQRDYPVMLHGSWNEPLVGGASRYKRFAVAYRTLPAKTFETVHRTDNVAVRRLESDGQTWFYALNNHGSDAAVELTLSPSSEVVDLIANRAVLVRGGRLKLRLPPYDLRTFRTAGTIAVSNVVVDRDPGAYEHLRTRLASFVPDLSALRPAMPGFSKRFAEVLNRARDFVREGDYASAERELPFLLDQEIELRLWMTTLRPRMVAKKASRTLVVDGSLDEWQDLPSAAQLDSADHLANDHHFGHHWSGVEDLSATMWTFHDGTDLAVAVRVGDDHICSKDGIVLRFAPNFQSLAEGQAVPGETIFKIAAPEGSKPVELRRNGAHLVSRPDKGGYTIEGTIPLSALGVKPGDTTGLHLVVEEVDFPDYPLPKFPWSRVQHMEWPVNPWWTWYRDAQCAGELHLEE